MNSIRATQFRQWATSVLREFAIRGYVLDKKRMENGSFLGEDYFEHQLPQYGKMKVEDKRVQPLLDSIHLHHKGYDQEGYIKTKNKEYE